MEMEGVFVNGTSELLKTLVYAVDEELDRDYDRSQDLNDQLERLKGALEMIETLTDDAERNKVNNHWLQIEESLKKLVYAVKEELAKGGGGELKRLKKTLEMIEDVTCDAEKKQVNDAAVKLWLIKLKGVAYDADDVLDKYFYKAVMQSKSNIKVIPVLDDPNRSLPDIIEKLDRLSREIANIESSSSTVDYTQQQEKVTIISITHNKLSDHSELKLRYDNLSTHLKQCFSYFSLLPKDTTLDRETLIQMWMAEGFLEPSNGGNQNSLEDIGNEYFNTLLSFSLFQNVVYDELGDIVTFKLHSSVHDFAQSVAGRHEAFVQLVAGGHEVTSFENLREYEESLHPKKSEYEESENLLDYEESVHPKKSEYEESMASSETRRLRLVQGPYLPAITVFSGKKLRTILCESICSKVDIHCLQLRVLHLPRVQHLNVLSPLRLRYLHLSLCDVNNISISHLYLLQTLNLSKCKNVHKLLEEIGSLEMLRHLNFSSSDVKELPESIFKLFNLRTLDISRCDIGVLPVSVGSLENLLSLDISHTPITKLPDSITDIFSLRKLEFHHCHNLKALPSNFGALTQLRSLDLGFSGITELPNSISRISSLKRFNFKYCSKLDALPHDFGALTQLGSLNLEGTKIRELPESLVSNLWKFESVNIRRLEVLMPYLVRKMEEKNALPALQTRESILAGLYFLRVLEIRYLENVRGLEEAEKIELRNKQNLRELSLKWEEEVANDNSVMVLEGLRPHPILKKLVIENFGGVKLPRWMGSSSIHCLPNLVELYLSNCNSCERLPALGMLPCLRILWIYGMRSMKCLAQEFYYQEEEQATPITILIPSLTRFYQQEEEEDTTSSANALPITISFPSLTRLELGDMDNLEEWIAPPPPYYIFFPVLETLSIIGCCELTSIPDFQSCTSLRELTIEDCDKLNKESPSEVYHSLDSITANGRYLVKQITSGPTEHSGIRDIAALENEKFLYIRNLENVRGGTEVAEKTKLKDKQHLENLYLFWNSSSSNDGDDDDEWIDRSVNDGMVLEGLQPHPNLKMLTISGFRGVKLPKWMGLPNYLPHLVDLYFYGCNSCEQLPALGMFPSLRILKIEGMNSVQNLAEDFYYYQQQERSGCSNNGAAKELKTGKQTTTPSSSSEISVFPSLVELSLMDMSILEEWAAPHHSFKSFRSLESLVVSGCLRLKSIPFTSCSSLKSLVLRNTWDEAVNLILASAGGERLISLASVSIQYSPQLDFFPVVLHPNNTHIQSLEIAHCSNFQGFRILDNEEFQAKVSSDTGFNTSISSLCSLKLFDCPALTSVPDLRKWTSLTDLWIEDCDKLKESFSYSLKSLTHLQTLYVDRFIDLPQK